MFIKKYKIIFAHKFKILGRSESSFPALLTEQSGAGILEKNVNDKSQSICLCLVLILAKYKTLRATHVIRAPNCNLYRGLNLTQRKKTWQPKFHQNDQKDGKERRKNRWQYRNWPGKLLNQKCCHAP